MTPHNFMELSAKEEYLNPELIPYLSKMAGFNFLNHPLVQQVNVDLEKAAFVNQLFEHKKEMIQNAFLKQDWATYIFSHERPYRLDALIELINLDVMNPVQYWKSAGSVWTDSENIGQNLKKWKSVWSAKIPSRSSCMSDKEIEIFHSLPEKIEVYRGIAGSGNRKGLSWTLNRDNAIWFAKRFNEDRPRLVVASVERRFAYAYFNCRNESEIVTDKVRIKTTENLL